MGPISGAWGGGCRCQCRRNAISFHYTAVATIGEAIVYSDDDDDDWLAERRARHAAMMPELSTEQFRSIVFAKREK